DIDLSRFNVVIGSNAAGKSNFISIFKFLRDIACHGLRNAIAMQGGSEFIRNTKIGNQRDLVIRVAYLPDQKLDIIDHTSGDNSLLGIQSSESTYEFAIRFNAEGDGFAIVKDRLVIGCEVSSCERTGTGVRKTCNLGRGEIQVTNEHGEVKFAVHIPDGCPLSQDEIIPVFFRNVHLQKDALLLESPYAYPLPHVEKFFDRIAVYDIDPKLPKRGAVMTGKRDLEEDARNLAVVVKTIIEDPEKKRKFSNLLHDILPFVEDFSVKKFMDVSFILTLRDRYAKNHDLPAFALSDGTIAIFALIIVLYFEDKPFIVIEEPVSHIHPFIVARIMAMMKESSERKQLMITTHSTEVVRHVSLADILLISRDSEGFSVVSRPADKEEVRTFLENEIGIEELYVQNLLGL
ncbi:MAG: AAA family ATPase, partial [Methanoregula sp.]|nr:AAA family ATPase [Methanoregula sp.]